MKRNTGRWLGYLLSLVMLFMVIPEGIVKAEETYPYTIFAASSKNGAISIDANSLCVNGNMATNGAITSTLEMNINGEITENAGISMPSIGRKIDGTYFSAASERYSGDFISEEMNQNINQAVLATGSMKLSGNVNVNSAIKAGEDIVIDGQTLNANQCVMYTPSGDIIIKSDNVSITGLIYAPNGAVEITAQNLNLNSVVVIAQTVRLDCVGANINYSESMGRFVGGAYAGGEPTVTPTEAPEEEELLDSDGDGVPDAVELKLGSNVYLADEDGDGLSDYEEIFELGTDPKKNDMESARDTDEDGLTDIEEHEYGTDIYRADSDKDGLTDKEEQSIYKTNPLNEDTDGDGLSDGDELILGTNPVNPDADGDGIYDGEEVFEQEVSEHRFEDGLFVENDAVVSELVVATKGNANSEVSVSEYTGYLSSEQTYYVGKSIEIAGEDIESGRISFELSEDYELKEYQIGENVTNGLLICYNDGEKTVPLETEFDAATGTLSAEISAEGNYFVLNVVDWYAAMGYDLSKGVIATYTESDKSVSPEKRANIVFVIDTTFSMAQYLGKVKMGVEVLSESLEAAEIYANFALVEYKDIVHDGKSSTKLRKNGDSAWYQDGAAFCKYVNMLSTSGGYDEEETALDGLALAYQTLSGLEVESFVVLVTDAASKIDNSYGFDSMNVLTSAFYAGNIHVSAITVERRQEEYAALCETTGGILLNLAGMTTEEFGKLSDFIIDETNGGYWITLEGLMPEMVKLERKPSEESETDTDHDKLTDWEELDGIAQKDIFNATSFVGALGIELPMNLPDFPVYSYHSNPAKADTDNDGIDDEEENFIETKPKYADTDGDGLDDGTEYINWYDPLAVNSDGDSFSDYQEYLQGTDPFTYNYSLEDGGSEFVKGYLMGDSLKDPSVPALIGQMASGITPGVGTVADIRDVIANAAYGDWVMSALSAVGFLPGPGDAVKISGQITEFVAKNLDKSDELAAFAVKLAQKYPDVFAKVFPSIADPLLDSIKRGDSYSKEFYEQISQLLVKMGKEIPTGLEFLGEVTVKVVDDVKPWEAGPLVRGKLIDILMGNNLGETFKTYDRYVDGVATSFKSIDPRCVSYQSASKFYSRLKGYAEAVINGKNTITISEDTVEITQKALSIVFPEVVFTDEQVDVLKRLIEEYGEVIKIEFFVIP